MTLREHLIKAKHSLDFAAGDLWDAYEKATPMGKLAILDAREKAMDLLNDLAELEAAAEAESNATDP